MDFLLRKYGVIFTEFDGILTNAESILILSNAVNITTYLLSKMSITVVLYT